MESPTLTLPETGGFVVKHSIFCGKDVGLTVYAHPAILTALLPAPVVLTDAETIVLCATVALKASYDGRKPRRDEAARHGVDGAAFDAAQASLRDKGLMDARGAVTPDGRNVEATHPMRNKVR